MLADRFLTRRANAIARWARLPSARSELRSVVTERLGYQQSGLDERG